MVIYLDSSAIVKLVTGEAEATALRTYLADETERSGPACSSSLAHTEVRRAATHNAAPLSAAAHVLDQLEIIDLDRTVLTEAGILPGRVLRSLDAIHVAVALREDVDAFVTYDARQAEAAASCGLRVVTPH
ncbi:type II toxin-antitoxin system VapC family toxin [Microbacterium sp. KR10-403]|uniref:type II toxin-antitoxin system VapC family toxin n=1 Tax=Microbacterium sp. KR10-403 TaxID=3158581 RepID=UPI0032E4CF6B